MHLVVFEPPQSFYLFCAIIKYIGSIMTNFRLIIEKNTLGRMRIKVFYGIIVETASYLKLFFQAPLGLCTFSHNTNY